MPTLRSLAWMVLFLPACAFAATPTVTVIRCPDGGVQPQAAVDGGGKIHLIYLKGDDAKSDVMYVTSTDGGKTWGTPLRVNSHPGSAIAVGTVRGAHLALGKGGRPHVAWMGSQIAEPRGPAGATPMCYARLNDAGDAFEPQRNLITTAPGLDGGGSIAADGAGHVYVAWHAPIPGMRGEQNRTVWLATSDDDGRTFAPERRMTDSDTGACGCCGMRLGVDSRGAPLALYRAANPTSRDVYLIYLSRSARNDYRTTKVHEWPVKTCPMSTMALATTPETTLFAWETAGQIYFTPAGRIAPDAWDRDATTAHNPTPVPSLPTTRLSPPDPNTPAVSGPTPVPAPGKATNRKHPSLAINKDGFTLLAWAEGTGWKKGGGLAWQVYGKDLTPLPDDRGGAKDLPVWSLPTAVAVAGGGFLIVY